jgi:biotin carboxyl carrier protein
MHSYRRLNIDGTLYETEVPEDWHKPYGGPVDRSTVRAFIPGIIQEVAVKPGSRVRRGQVLLLLEAMKMFNEVCADTGGTVREVAVRAGEIVEKGQLLLRLEPARDGE